MKINSITNSGNKINPLMLDSTKYNLGDYKFMFNVYPADKNRHFSYLMNPTYFKLSMYHGKSTRINFGAGVSKINL